MNETPIKTWKTLTFVFALISIVLSILIMSDSVAGTRLASEQKKYPFISPLRFSQEQKDIVVNLQPIREYLRDLVNKKGKNSVSLYFEFFNTGANISINQDLKILPASLAKLPLAMVIMKKVERGEMNLNDQLTLQESQRDHGSGGLFNLPAGSKLAVAELLKQLLHNSDNTAYHMLADNVGKEEYSEIINETGLDGLFDDNGKVSAKEYTRVLRSLYTASFLNIENSSYLLNLLTKTEFDGFLGAPIPPEVPFAHKWGAHLVNHVFSDAGIVYLQNRPYVLAVMVQENGTPDDEKMRLKSCRIFLMRFINTFQSTKNNNT